MFTYLQNCTDGNGDAISDMVDAARDITYRTFNKYCPDSKAMFWKLHADYHVRFSKSKFQGKLCYFVTHSCIEYVWIKE